nr:hypothetical protein [Tanacetum cinerariifolium]
EPDIGSASDISAKKKGRTVAITTKDMQKRRNDVKARTTLLLALPDEHQLRFSNTSVLTASTQVSTTSADVAAASISHDTVCAYIASQSNGSQIKYKDINQINEDDIEEIDIKFDKSKVECFNCHKMGHFARECRAPRSQDRGWDWSYMANKEENHALVADEEAPTEFALMANGTDLATAVGTDLATAAETDLANHSGTDIANHFGTRSRTRRVLDTVLFPPPAQVYSPLKKDMSWTGLPEFAYDTITDYSRPSSSIESNSSDLQNSNSSISKHGESSDSIMSKPMIKFVKAADSPTIIKTNKVKTARKPPVEYAEMYRSTSKSPKVRDIMFAVCACARHQVTPKECHLHAVKRIFRYLKGHPKLGLCYPKEYSFNLVAYSDSDYGGATQDRKLTTGGCQFLGRRLISCAICIVKNPANHSKTKHIEIRHHFIRDCYENNLISVDHIHTDDNVADLLTKPFDVGRFQYLVKSEHNVDFHQIVDFVEASHIRYAVTIPPTIYVTHIRQFWSTARIETTNEGTKILATVDGKPRTISESSIRRNLKLNDKEGISSLPDAEIFENLALMGYNILPNQKFTFQKGQFSHQWKFLIHTIMQCLSPKSTGFNEFSSNIATVVGEGSGTLTEPHHTPSPQEQHSLDHDTLSPSYPTATTKTIHTSTPTKIHSVRQYSRRATQIAQSKALPTTADEHASLLRDDSQGEAFPTARIKLLEDKDKGSAELSGDDAPIKGRSMEIKEEVGVEKKTKRGSNDTKEMIARDAKIARIHVEEELKMMIDGLDRSNEMNAKHLHKYEQATADLTIGEKIELINELVKYQDHHEKILKGMTLEEIREKFIHVWKQIEDFVPMASKEEAERFKRKGLRLEQGSAKRMKTSKDVFEEDINEMMQLVPVEEVYVEALQVKNPIIDWEIHSKGQRVLALKNQTRMLSVLRMLSTYQ